MYYSIVCRRQAKAISIISYVKDIIFFFNISKIDSCLCRRAFAILYSKGFLLRCSIICNKLCQRPLHYALLHHAQHAYCAVNSLILVFATKPALADIYILSLTLTVFALTVPVVVISPVAVIVLLVEIFPDAVKFLTVVDPFTVKSLDNVRLLLTVNSSVVVFAADKLTACTVSVAVKLTVCILPSALNNTLAYMLSSAFLSFPTKLKSVFADNVLQVNTLHVNVGVCIESLDIIVSLFSLKYIVAPLSILSPAGLLFTVALSLNAGYEAPSKAYSIANGPTKVPPFNGRYNSSA